MAGQKSRLVYVRYWDHVLFKGADPSLYKQPSLREAVGWLEREDEQAILIVFDRSISHLPHEKVNPLESGLLILKGDIVELKEI